jgi:hypothetical protein
MNDWDSMSSFGLLVSNIVSSFIIINHPLFGISYNILNKNSAASLGISEKPRPELTTSDLNCNMQKSMTVWAKMEKSHEP